MTSERLEELQSVRAHAQELRDVLGRFDASGLDFIDFQDRREMRMMLMDLSQRISDHIHDEIGFPVSSWGC